MADEPKGAEEPAAEEPEAEEPAAEEPAAEGPAAAKKTATERPAKKSAAEKPAAPQPIESISQGVTVVTSIVGLIGTIIGGFAAIAGNGAALVREEGNLILVGCLLAALGFMVILWITLRQDRRTRNPGFRKMHVPDYLIGAGLVLGGVMLLLVSAVTVPSIARVPKFDSLVTVDVDGRQKLTGSIAVDGLRASEFLHVRIIGDPQVGGGTEFEHSTIIATIDQGGNPDGTARVPIDLTLDPRDYRSVRVQAWGGQAETGIPDCAKTQAIGGNCLSYGLAGRDPSAHLVGSLEGTGASTALAVKADVRGLSPDQRLMVTVYGYGAVPPGPGSSPVPGVPLYQGLYPPDGTGVVHQDVSVAIGQSQYVCAAAAVIDHSDAPIPTSRGPAFVDLCGIPNEAWLAIKR